jgi:hypothetical protein
MGVALAVQAHTGLCEELDAHTLLRMAPQACAAGAWEAKNTRRPQTKFVHQRIRGEGRVRFSFSTLCLEWRSWRNG